MSTEGRKLNVLIWVAHNLEASHIVEQYVENVSKVFAGHRVTVRRGKDSWRGVVNDKEVMICWGFDEQILDEAGHLRWIQFGSAGINHALSPRLLSSGIRLTTLKGVHPIPMAEHALSMMLALGRRLQVAIVNQHGNCWKREGIGPFVRELEGSIVGIIGMGRIGRCLAAKCRALGTKVIGTKASSASQDDADEWVDKNDLEPLLQNSDWVVLTAPSTDSTNKLIGAPQLAMMKPGAILINIARGQLVDEAALVDSLISGHLGGAGLDVFETEPLPDVSPLWQMENVVITPHVGGMTPHYGSRAAAIVAENLAAYLDGRKMPSEFDREKGY